MGKNRSGLCERRGERETKRFDLAGNEDARLALQMNGGGVDQAAVAQGAGEPQGRARSPRRSRAASAGRPRG